MSSGDGAFALATRGASRKGGEQGSGFLPGDPALGGYVQRLFSGVHLISKTMGTQGGIEPKIFTNGPSVSTRGKLLAGSTPASGAPQWGREMRVLER